MLSRAKRWDGMKEVETQMGRLARGGGGIGHRDQAIAVLIWTVRPCGRPKERLQTGAGPLEARCLDAREAVSARVEDEERDKSKTVAASNAWLGTRPSRAPCNEPVGEFPWQVSLAALGKLIVARLSLIGKRWRDVAWPRGGETSP